MHGKELLKKHREGERGIGRDQAMSEYWCYALNYVPHSCSYVETLTPEGLYLEIRPN